jgi:hypothetical protein
MSKARYSTRSKELAAGDTRQIYSAYRQVFERITGRNLFAVVQSRVIRLLGTIVFHAFELVFGLRLGTWNSAVVACRSQ